MANKEYIGATSSEDITAGDTAASNFAGGVCRAIWVGGAGDVNVVYESGQTQIFKGAQAGIPLLAEAIRVNSTGTTATDLVAMY